MEDKLKASRLSVYNSSLLREAVDEHVMGDCEDTKVCRWTESDDGLWYGPCGVEWEFIYDGPKENKVNYCPRCGGGVVVVQEKDDE